MKSNLLAQTSSLPPFSSSAPDYNETVFGDKAEKLGTIGGIINELLPYLLVIAGLILFGMIIMGGFQILTAVDDPKKAEAGSQLITQSLIGFLIIFAAFWIAQAIQAIFGIRFLNP